MNNSELVPNPKKTFSEILRSYVSIVVFGVFAFFAFSFYDPSSEFNVGTIVAIVSIIYAIILTYGNKAWVRGLLVVGFFVVLCTLSFIMGAISGILHLPWEVWYVFTTSYAICYVAALFLLFAVSGYIKRTQEKP
jgi:hypothetical protein